MSALKGKGGGGRSGEVRANGKVGGKKGRRRGEGRGRKPVAPHNQISYLTKPVAVQCADAAE